MATIGNLADAILAEQDELEEYGGGSTRKVYIDADKKFIYKVEYDEDCNLEESYNRYEHCAQRIASRITSLSKHACPTALYEVAGRWVLCMPFYEKRVGLHENTVADTLWELSRSVGFPLNDIAYFNLRRTANGIVKIIDMGDNTKVNYLLRHTLHSDLIRKVLAT